MNRFARSPPRRIWGKFSNPRPIVAKATQNIVMKSRRGNVVEDPCPVGCDAISKRPRKSATHPTRTMRTPQTRNASSVMPGRVRCIPVVEGRETHLVSVVRLLGNRVPKAFMAYAANQPFRSRSLVRSRIGAFRASDAGSNPAGSIPVLNTIRLENEVATLIYAAANRSERARGETHDAAQGQGCQAMVRHDCFGFQGDREELPADDRAVPRRDEAHPQGL